MKRNIDCLIAVILAALVLSAAFLFAYPMPHPQAWCELSIAAGLRAPGMPFPFFGRAAMEAVFASLGVTSGLAVLGVLGKVALAAIVLLVYLLATDLLNYFRPVDVGAVERTCMRLSAGVAALACGFCEPVCRVTQCLSPEAVTLLLALVAAKAIMHMLMRQSFRAALAVAALTSALAAESLVGVVLFALFAYVYSWCGDGLGQPTDKGLSDRVLTLRKWWLLFAAAGGFAFAAVLAWVLFACNGGAESLGLSGNLNQIVFIYVTSWVSRFMAAATLFGWLGLALVAFIPAVVTFVHARAALDGEHELGFGVGFMHMLAALLALSQLAGYSPFWASNWGFSPVVGSALLQVCACALSALVLGLSLAVWGLNREDLTSNRAFAAVGALLVVACFVGRTSSDVPRGLTLIKRFTRLMIDDARNAEFLITDGRFDDALRLALAEMPNPPHLISYFGGNSPMDRKLRETGLHEEADRLASGEGPAALLHTWVRRGGKRIAAVAAQMGFESWKQNVKPVPPAGATCVRVWPDETVRKASQAAGAALGDELVRENLGDIPQDRVVRGLVEGVAWRLARLANCRAEAAMAAGDAACAETETARAEALDAANASAREFKEKMRLAHTRMRVATPWETMRQAVARADFGLASVYASRILKDMPENRQALFVMAMHEAGQANFVRAAEYFDKYLKLYPNDPVVLNNRAMVRIALGQLAEAEADARAAQKLLPDAPEVKNTLKRIVDARTAK